MHLSSQTFELQNMHCSFSRKRKWGWI